MNPFTESTVARPLSENSRAGPSPFSQAAPQPAPASLPPPVHHESAPAARLGITPARRPASWLGGLAKRLRRGAAAHGGMHAGHRGRAAAWVLLLGLGLAVPGLAGAVDVNAATLEQLRSVRGIGPKTAQTIIDERTRGGKFESFDDLSERVKGIGAKKAAALQASGLTLGGAGASQGADPAAKAKPASARSAPAAAARTGGK